MKDAITIYAIIQSITSAYGLSVIESVRPLVEERLRTQGYVKNKNSLYTFSSTLSDIGKCFIPFYYFVAAMNIINKKGNIDKQVKDGIESKAYVNPVDIPPVQIIEEKAPESIVEEPKIVYEKPERYKARRTDIQIYDTYETPVEFMTRELEKEDGLGITPFTGEPQEEVHEVVSKRKDEITNRDIAKAITELSPEELEALRDEADQLAEYKRNLLLEKDVA